MGYSISLITMIVVLAWKVFVLTWLGERWLLRCMLFVSVAMCLVAVDIQGLLVCLARQGHHLK
jgi:presenilin-like A22 family membrane protease